MSLLNDAAPVPHEATTGAGLGSRSHDSTISMHGQAGGVRRGLLLSLAEHRAGRGGGGSPQSTGEPAAFADERADDLVHDDGQAREAERCLVGALLVSPAEVAPHVVIEDLSLPSLRRIAGVVLDLLAATGEAMPLDVGAQLVEPDDSLDAAERLGDGERLAFVVDELVALMQEGLRYSIGPAAAVVAAMVADAAAGRQVLAAAREAIEALVCGEAPEDVRRSLLLSAAAGGVVARTRRTCALNAPAEVHAQASGGVA